MTFSEGRSTQRSAGWVLALGFAILGGCIGKATPVVVIYTSVDQPYAEPVLQDFERKSGIRVLPVYDVEAAKSTGLANRLLAERQSPQADIFWSSEISQTLRLKSEGILAPFVASDAGSISPSYRDPGDFWTAMGLRARILLVNTGRVPENAFPSSLFDLVSPRWKPGEVGFANPLFGTSATHASALSVSLSPERALGFFAALKASGARVLDGNSVVRDLVVRGDLKVGITDTDDARVALAGGGRVRVIFPDTGGLGTLYIPSTVALVAGAPHPSEARALAEYLTGAEVESSLMRAGFFCASVRRAPQGMAVDWQRVGREGHWIFQPLKDLVLR